MIRNRYLPLSGTEPLLNIDKWSTPRGKKVANCYGFALDDYLPLSFDMNKQQPGDRSGLSRRRLDLSTCEVARRVLSDNPRDVIYPVRAETACKPGYHKVFLFNDPNPDTGDYHFYRQVKDLMYKPKRGEHPYKIADRLQIPRTNVVPGPKTGTYIFKNVNAFAHKMGYATGALMKDSCNRLIKDPRKACRGSGNRNYKKECGSFCAKSGFARTRQDIFYPKF